MLSASFQELINTGIFTILYALTTLFHLIFAVKSTSNIFAAVSIQIHRNYFLTLARLINCFCLPSRFLDCSTQPPMEHHHSI